MKILRHICFLSSALIIFTILLVSCTVNQQNVNSNLAAAPKPANSNSNVNSFEASEFLKNKELWNSQKINNYELVVEARNSSNIARQVAIKVENRQAKSIIKIDAADSGSGEPYKAFDTIDKIFNIVERESKIKHDVLKINYDSVLGYPSEVISDESVKMADEEFSIKVISLKAQ